VPDRYIAQPFVASSPEAEVMGRSMLAFSQNLQAELIKPILPKHSLDDIDPDQWYPAQSWFDALKEIHETMGGQSSQALVALGKQVVESATMPPEIQTIADVLKALNIIHHINIRNVHPEEGYTLEQLGDQHYRIYVNTPSTTYGIYGYLWGMCARYCGDDEDFELEIVDNPNSEVHPGMAFELKWGKYI